MSGLMAPHRTTQKHAEHEEATGMQKKYYFLFFGFFYFYFFLMIS